jgi:hypothetical protein
VARNRAVFEVGRKIKLPLGPKNSMLAPFSKLLNQVLPRPFSRTLRQISKVLFFDGAEEIE